MPAEAGPAWRAVDPDDLRFTYWPVDVAVFNGTTGETHLLSELPAFVLHLLGQHPWPFSSLCEMVAGQCELADDEPWRTRFAVMLNDLAALELIEQISDPVAVAHAVRPVTNDGGMPPAS